jgi:hypothetical protein
VNTSLDSMMLGRRESAGSAVQPVGLLLEAESCMAQGAETYGWSTRCSLQADSWHPPAGIRRTMPGRSMAIHENHPTWGIAADQ